MPAPDTVALISFATPPEPPRRGANRQRFRVLVRRSSFASSDVPLVTLRLYENGGLLATLLTDAPVTSDTGEIVTGTWDAALLADVTGTGVQVRVEGTHTGERTVEVGAAEWQFKGAMVTQVGLLGTTAPYRRIASKADSTPTFVDKTGVDTLLAILTETPNDPIAVEVVDLSRPVISETRSITQQFAAFSVDTLIPRITDTTPGPVQSTPSNITASDGLVPVLTEAPGDVITVVTATDTSIPVIADTSVLVVDSVEFKVGTDTLIPVVFEAIVLEPFIGFETRDAIDDMVPVISETAARVDYFDVDRIEISGRPFGKIVITPV